LEFGGLADALQPEKTATIHLFTLFIWVACRLVLLHGRCPMAR
jgi:hypothetical protein